MTREPSASFLRRAAVWSIHSREETRPGLACRPVMHHRSVRFSSIFALVASSVACDVIKIDHENPIAARAKSLAEGYCAAYQACDCVPFGNDALHPDPDQCVEEEQARLLRAFQEAEENNLV